MKLNSKNENEKLQFDLILPNLISSNSIFQQYRNSELKNNKKI